MRHFACSRSSLSLSRTSSHCSAASGVAVSWTGGSAGTFLLPTGCDGRGRKVEPVSAYTNLVSAIEERISKIREQRLRAKFIKPRHGKGARFTLETNHSPDNLRRCRVLSCNPEMRQRDRTAWHR